jgi:hypothetical protein
MTTKNEPWTWPELIELVTSPTRDADTDKFVAEYGFIGALALEIACIHPDNPQRLTVDSGGAGVSAPFCSLADDDCDQCSLPPLFGTTGCIDGGGPYNQPIGMQLDEAYNRLVRHYRRTIR